MDQAIPDVVNAVMVNAAMKNLIHFINFSLKGRIQPSFWKDESNPSDPAREHIHKKSNYMYD